MVMDWLTETNLEDVSKELGEVKSHLNECLALLKELHEMDPSEAEWHGCFFCGVSPVMGGRLSHADYCLWKRAGQLVGGV